MQWALSIPDWESVQFQSTVTSLVYQPLLPCVPWMAGASAGGVSSVMYVTVLSVLVAAVWPLPPASLAASAATDALTVPFPATPRTLIV